jgi:hypothetical protein
MVIKKELRARLTSKVHEPLEKILGRCIDINSQIDDPKSSVIFLLAEEVDVVVVVGIEALLP